jgi:hypothetical protein
MCRRRCSADADPGTPSLFENRSLSGEPDTAGRGGVGDVLDDIKLKFVLGAWSPPGG